MRIIIIGAVAAGTSAAAKARRNSEDAEIIIYEMDSDISYSGCGLPYYIGDETISRKIIVPRNSEFFKKKYNVDIFTKHRVEKIIPSEKKIEVSDLTKGKKFTDSYDKLVIATGAKSFIPPISGIDESEYFTLRNVRDADKIKEYILENEPSRAIIIGTGFIGLEMTEAFVKRGIKVSLVEIADHVMPALDTDVSFHIEEYLKEKNVEIYLNKRIDSIRGSFSDTEVVLQDGTVIQSDFLLLAAGIKPNIDLAKEAGIKIGDTGSIWTDDKMHTDTEDIFACGDCAESFMLIDKTPIYRPLGSTANKTGRITGETLFDKPLAFRGILGTGIFKVFDLAVGQTGLTEKQAKMRGIQTVICNNIKPDKPEYMGGENLYIKAVADKETGRLLGVQIVGKEGVDKRIDVFATAITFGALVSDLFHLDLAYAPPFSTTKDPVMYTGMILENAIYNERKLISPQELMDKMIYEKDIQIIDARVSNSYEKGHVNKSLNIPHENFRTEKDKLNPEKLTVTYCNKGTTGNATQNILINSGFKNVYNLSGGHEAYNKLNCMLKDRQGK